MDNPNPIYYRDLVTPDDSIQKLIEQLTALIAKYEEAKQKIQGSAAEMAQQMKNVSGATEEQRQQIALVTAQSEKLAANYERYNQQEREAYRQKQSLIQATKEEQQIDKLLVQIKNSAAGSYNRLSAMYRLNKIRLNEMTAEERRSTEAGRQLETETRKIYEEMSRLQKATGKYTLEVGHYENALRGLPGVLGRITTGFAQMKGQLSEIGNSGLPLGAKAMQGFSTIAFGMVGILSTVVGAFGKGAKTMRDFEQATANLSTILGVNVKDMEALTESALQLGRTTEYTASQVVQLQTELAKLGFSQGAILSMSKPVLQFATAVGANLAEAAEVAGSTLRAFNLTSADTEEVLATLAVATNNSALSFDKIRTSIGTVFPIANAYGISVKDTTALLGALANAGFDASTAATATRNILLNLANANGKLAKSLGGAVSTYDEIIDGMIKLRNSGIDVGEALELTDKRSVAAFSAFLSGAEAARELRESLENVSGELQRISEERLNTVEGSTKIFKSAWEGLTLAFRESQGAIKDTIDWLTRLVTSITNAFFPISEATTRYTKIFQEQIDTNREYARINIRETLKAYEEGGEKLALRLGVSVRQANKIAEKELPGVRKAAEMALMQLDELERKTSEDVANAADAARKKQEELTKEQKKAADAARKQRLADRRAVVEAINLEIAAETAGTEKMLQLRLDKVEAERQVELEQNRQKVKTERQDEAAINAKYDKQRIETEKQFAKEVSQARLQMLQAEQQAIQMQIAITEDGTEEILALRLSLIEKQRQIELEQNKQKAENVRQSEAAINAKYDKQALKQSADFHTKLAQRELAAQQDLSAQEFGLLDRNERQKTIFRLEQEKRRLEAILKMNETASEKLTETEIKAIMATIEGIDKQKSRLGYNNLYELLGLNVDSDQQDALNTAIDSIKDSISSIVDSWNAAAEAAVNAADKQVEAAQKTLDAEIEARNAGYANQVENAQRELDLAKKNQQKALQEKQKAQKAQLAIDSITQASSLVTASANIWSSLSGIPVVGPALAAAALITMWASFAVAKVKAAQISKQTEQYGEGTVELLEGGSHASGHDIDLGTKRDGTRRRAEGGEFFAIINKRNSRKYRNVIPDVINSFNDGSFADKYQKSNEMLSGTALNIFHQTDVSRLEQDVAAIRRQGDESRYIDNLGNVVVRYKNLTRKIKS